MTLHGASPPWREGIPVPWDPAGRQLPVRAKWGIPRKTTPRRSPREMILTPSVRAMRGLGPVKGHADEGFS